jgi:hypothetical protein
LSPDTPAWLAQFAQQKIRPSCSTPWPTTLQPQCSHTGAIAWIAHSNESNVCIFPALVTVNALSYSFPQTSHFAIVDSPLSCELGRRDAAAAVAVLLASESVAVSVPVGWGLAAPVWDQHSNFDS